MAVVILDVELGLGLYWELGLGLDLWLGLVWGLACMLDHKSQGPTAFSRREKAVAVVILEVELGLG